MLVVKGSPKGCVKKTFLFNDGFCSGSFILLYFYVKLLVHFHFDNMKKFHVKIYQNKASRTKTVLKMKVFFGTPFKTQQQQQQWRKNRGYPVLKDEGDQYVQEDIKTIKLLFYSFNTANLFFRERFGWPFQLKNIVQLTLWIKYDHCLKTMVHLTGNLNSLKTVIEGWGIAIMDMEESCPIVEESCPVGRNHYHGL